MASSNLEQILQLANKRKPAKGVPADKSAQSYPAPEKAPEGSNLSPDDQGNPEVPPGADESEWKDNEDMHAMGVTCGPAGTVFHGAMKIGHVVSTGNAKNRYVGIHHPSGAQTDAHPNRAKAAMALMGYHTYMPRKKDDKGSKVKLSNVDTVLELAAKSKERSPKEGFQKYGAIEYADSKNKAYPVDTAERVRAAWGYINHPENAKKYPRNGVSLDSVKANIKAAAKKFGVDINE